MQRMRVFASGSFLKFQFACCQLLVIVPIPDVREFGFKGTLDWEPTFIVLRPPQLMLVPSFVEARHNSPMAMPYSHLSVRTYGDAPGGHSHDHFQVLWPLHGCLDLEIEGRGVALQVGDGLLVRPGDRHVFESRNGSRCLVLNTSEPVWQHRSDRPEFARSASQMAAFLAVALEEQLPLALESGAQLLAQSWGTYPTSTSVRRTVNWKKLTAWTAIRLAQRLLAADLADQVHLSESQFRARCVEELGVTPMQWIRQLRLNKAQQLREAGVSVADISIQVGYESASALTAAMRRSRQR